MVSHQKSVFFWIYFSKIKSDQKKLEKPKTPISRLEEICSNLDNQTAQKGRYPCEISGSPIDLIGTFLNTVGITTLASAR